MNLLIFAKRKKQNYCQVIGTTMHDETMHDESKTKKRLRNIQQKSKPQISINA